LRGEKRRERKPFCRSDKLVPEIFIQTTAPSSRFQAVEMADRADRVDVLVVDRRWSGIRRGPSDVPLPVGPDLVGVLPFPRRDGVEAGTVSDPRSRFGPGREDLAFRHRRRTPPILILASRGSAARRGPDAPQLASDEVPLPFTRNWAQSSAARRGQEEDQDPAIKVFMAIVPPWAGINAYFEETS